MIISPKIIIGFTGLMGSGKGMAVSYLVEKYGFKADALSNRVKEEVLKKGEEVNRITLPETAGYLRKKFDPDILAKKTWEKMIQEKPDMVALDGIRSVEETNFFKKLPNFYLVAIEANQKLRFERLTKRVVPGRTEPQTWAEFLAAEQRDRNFGMNIPGSIKLADFHIINEGTAKDLYQELDKVLEKILSNLPT